MPHFLKDWATILAEILCQVSRTYEHTAGRDAALTFPAGVKLFWPSIIQLSHCSQRRSLNGLFREISNSWRMLVKRPRITAMSFFVWHTAHFTESTRWAWKESHTSRLFFLRRPQGHDCHTFSIHSFIPTSSIHPFRWQCMRTPGGKFSFGNFCLKITKDLSFVPSARHASTTGNCDFLWPVVLTNTVFSPFPFPILGSGWWQVKPNRRFVHVADVGEFVI